MKDYAEIICEAKGEEQVYFHEFGSYQGEWILVSKRGGTYYIYKDWYGSCGGCDALLALYDYGDSITDKQQQNFAADYKPFAEIPEQVFLDMLNADTLSQAMPANIKLSLEDDYKTLPDDEAWRRITAGIKEAMKTKEQA